MVREHMVIGFTTTYIKGTLLYRFVFDKDQMEEMLGLVKDGYNV